VWWYRSVIESKNEILGNNIRPCLKTKAKRARTWFKRYSICLASVRPSVQTPVLAKKRKV
jgi:hypothetical protein